MAPNQPAADKTVLSILVKRTLYAQLRALAEKRGQSLADTCRDILNAAVFDIELTPADYANIALATQAKINERNKNNTTH